MESYFRKCEELGWEPRREDWRGEEVFEILFEKLEFRALVCFEGLDCHAATGIDFLDTSKRARPEEAAITSIEQFDQRFEINRAAGEQVLGVPDFAGTYVANGSCEGNPFKYTGWTYSCGHVVLMQHDEGDLGTEATLDLRIVKRGAEEVHRFPLTTNILT